MTNHTTETHEAMLHSYARKEVIRLFDNLAPKEVKAFREIRDRLAHYSESVVQTVVDDLVANEELLRMKFTDTTYLYAKKPRYYVRESRDQHTGNPIWFVESRSGTTFAQCTREAYAQKIVDALNDKE